MTETWFLSVDMQLFVLSPLFIYPLWRWPKKIGPAMTLLGIPAALCYTATIHLKWDVPLLILFSRQYFYTTHPFKIKQFSTFFDAMVKNRSAMKRFLKYIQFYYKNTLNRCPSYLVGILLGWALERTKNVNVTIKKVCLKLNIIDNQFYNKIILFCTCWF